MHSNRLIGFAFATGSVALFAECALLAGTGGFLSILGLGCFALFIVAAVAAFIRFGRKALWLLLIAVPLTLTTSFLMAFMTSVAHVCHRGLCL